MKSILKYSALVAAVILAGCKVDIDMEAKHSEIFSKSVVKKQGWLRAEVTDCTNHEDKTKESDGLIQLKAAINKHLPTVEYVDCSSKGLESFANFKLNYEVAGSPKNFENLNIYAEETDKDEYDIVLAVSSQFKRAFKDIQEELSFGDFEPRIKINFINDAAKDVLFTPVALWLDDEPVPIDFLKLDKGKEVQIKFSDVQREYLLNSKEQATVFFMEYQLD